MQLDQVILLLRNLDGHPLPMTHKISFKHLSKIHEALRNLALPPLTSVTTSCLLCSSYTTSDTTVNIRDLALPRLQHLCSFRSYL